MQPPAVISAPQPAVRRHTDTHELFFRTLSCRSERHVSPACVLGRAGTLPVAAQAVVSLRTQPDVTRLSRVPRLAQTHPVGMVTLGVVLTATRLRAAGAVRTDRTLVLTPVDRGDTETHSSLGQVFDRAVRGTLIAAK